jgi:hypothetical protein
VSQLQLLLLLLLLLLLFRMVLVAVDGVVVVMVGALYRMISCIGVVHNMDVGSFGCCRCSKLSAR